MPEVVLDQADLAFVDRQRVGRLATADADRHPYVVPVCFARLGSRLYVPIDAKPKRGDPRRLQRLRNLRARPEAVLLLDEYDDDWRRLRWLALRGHATILEGGNERAAALDALEARYAQYAAMRLAALDLPVIALAPQRVSRWVASAGQQPSPPAPPESAGMRADAASRSQAASAPDAAPSDWNPLVGTWALVAFELVGEDGQISHPYGLRPAGLLTYTADGRVSVHYAERDRPQWLGNLRDAPDAVKTAAADSFNAYAGRYSYRGDTVVHHVEISFFPGRVGTDLIRSVKLAGPVLTLSYATPGQPEARLTWRRVAS